MKKLLINFIRCGTLGWCLEIIFTSINALRKRNLKLMGNTSIWMFPIYGSMCLLSPFFKILKKQSKIEVSKDFICFDASIFKYLEVDMDLRKYFKINYNNKLYEVNEKSLEKALTCTTELFLNLYMKNIGLKL